MDLHELETISAVDLTASLISMGTILVVSTMLLIDEGVVDKITKTLKSIPLKIGDKVLDWCVTRQLKKEKEETVEDKPIFEIQKIFWETETGEKLDEYLPRTDIVKTQVEYIYENQLYRICLYDNERNTEEILEKATSQSRAKKIVFLFGNVNSDDFIEYSGPLQDFHGGVLARDILQDDRAELMLSVLYRGKEYDFKFGRDDLVKLTFEENHDSLSTSSTESGVLIRDSKNLTDSE